MIRIYHFKTGKTYQELTEELSVQQSVTQAENWYCELKSGEQWWKKNPLKIGLSIANKVTINLSSNSAKLPQLPQGL